MRKLLRIMSMLLLPVCTYAQTSTVIRGKVLHADSRQPIEGATVQLLPAAAKSAALITDAEGNFSLEQPAAAGSLEISFVGFETYRLKIPVNFRPAPALVVLLQPLANQLGNVEVSTGYESLPKERATGSFEKIGASTLRLQTSPNILDRLKGEATGISFDPVATRPALTIRGLSTINGPTSPLIVLDNFPYEGNINNINPDDVESVTILKDAAAASIWGARAGNGVIVITTKKGKQNQRLQVNGNANLSVQPAPDLFYSPRFIASKDYVAMEQMLFSKGYYAGMENTFNKAALTPVVETLIAHRDGRISTAQMDAQLAAYRQADFRQQASDYLYEPALLQQYSLSVSGGGNKMSHYLSGTYNRQQTSLGGEAGRISLRTTHRVQAGKRLEFGVAIQLTGLDNRSGRTDPNDIRIVNQKPSYLQLAGPGGVPLAVAKDYRTTYTDTAGGGKLLDWNYYPLEEYKYNSVRNRSLDATINFDARWQLLPALSASVQYQYERQQTESERLQTKESYAARTLINQFTQLNYTSGQLSYAVPVGAIREMIYSELAVHNGRAQLQWQPKWQQQQLSVMAGLDIRQANNSAEQYTSYGYNPDVLTTGKVDYVNFYPNFVTGFTQSIREGTGFGETSNRFVSWYANAGYQLTGKYLVSASIRKDASNLFGASSNDRGVPLWSAGIGWQIARESFYHVKWLPVLKLRATTGFSGNVDQSKSAYTVLAFLSGATGTNLPYASVTQVANPSLRWEKVHTTNIGLDFETRKQRLSGSLEYYFKKATDLFGGEPVDATAGLLRETLTANVAAMKGWGADVNLQSLNTTGRLIWRTSLLFSCNTNRVTDYYSGAQLPGRSMVSDGLTISARKGERLYRIASYTWAGLDGSNGDPMGYLDAVPSKDYIAIRGSGTTIDDIITSGSSVPEYFGSLGNTLQWRGLSLTGNLLYRLGYYYRRSGISYNSLFAGIESHEDYYQRWQQPGDEKTTHVPSMQYPANAFRDEFYLNSTVTVRKGDHIRLQFINIDYFPFQKAKHIALQNWQWYVNASNLGVIWKADKSRFDPDYPDQKIPPTYTIGTRIQF